MKLADWFIVSGWRPSTEAIIPNAMEVDMTRAVSRKDESEYNREYEGS
jgi:hypothetical protein